MVSVLTNSSSLLSCCADAVRHFELVGHALGPLDGFVIGEMLRVGLSSNSLRRDEVRYRAEE